MRCWFEVDTNVTRCLLLICALEILLLTYLLTYLLLSLSVSGVIYTVSPDLIFADII